MLTAKYKVDKERFKGLKDAQVQRGTPEQKATQIAASEVKQMRKREGRSKQNRT